MRGEQDSITSVLSDDILIHILDWVREPQDRKVWRLVSRGFLRAESLQRRELRALRRESLPRLLRLYRALERLDLSVCASLDDSFLSAALGGGAAERLNSVRLARAGAVGWRGLEALVAACPLLESVDLGHSVGVRDREAAALASAAGRLRELILDKCLGVTDVGLAKVAVACSHLERLSIKWCLEISDLGLDLLAKKCPEIRSLNLSYLKITNKSLKAISNLRNLEELSLVGCTCINDEGLLFLSTGSCTLKSIDISRCCNMTSNGLASLIEGQKNLQEIKAGHCFLEVSSCFLSRLGTLRETLTVLKIDGCHVSVSNLAIIGVNCKNLVEIGLSKCIGVTDDGISTLVASCSNLQVVDLTCCHSLTCNALTSIAEKCKRVEVIGIESCNLISQEGLYQVASCCSNLVLFDLTDCAITDSGLRCLSACSELQVLKLGLCPAITDDGLAHIGYNCKKLIELDLYRCALVTDNGMAAIATGCKRMKRLNLCYCNQITDAGMKHLGCLEELANLELRGLGRVTCLGINSIAVGCRSLVELDLKRCYSVDDAGLWALASYSENLRQLTISYCPVTGLGLCHLLGNLKCIQDVKMVHLSWVSIEGFELALRAACGKLKKLKLLFALKNLLSLELLQMLQVRGCRIRWVNKPLVYKS